MTFKEDLQDADAEIAVLIATIEEAPTNDKERLQITAVVRNLYNARLVIQNIVNPDWNRDDRNGGGISVPSSL
jgi:hypothetical protein